MTFHGLFPPFDSMSFLSCSSVQSPPVASSSLSVSFLISSFGGEAGSSTHRPIPSMLPMFSSAASFDAAAADTLAEGICTRSAAVSRGLPGPVSLPRRPSLAAHSMTPPGVVTCVHLVRDRGGAIERSLYHLLESIRVTRRRRLGRRRWASILEWLVAEAQDVGHGDAPWGATCIGHGTL